MTAAVLYGGLSLLLLFALSGCEKVVDVDLNEANPALVIDAILDAENNSLAASVSLSGPYFDVVSTTPVTPDVIEVTLPDGATEALVPATGRPGQPVDSSRAGQYVLRRREPLPLGTYTMYVEYGGQAYTASSTLRAPIVIQELLTEFAPETIRNDEGYSVELQYDDPGDERNFYRIEHWVNGELQREPDDFIVIDDVLTDGTLARTPIFEQVFDVGDTVRVRLRHLDEPGYDYYRTLAETVGGGRGPGGAAPGNPISNWEPEALGVFVAYSASTAEVVVVE